MTEVKGVITKRMAQKEKMSITGTAGRIVKIPRPELKPPEKSIPSPISIKKKPKSRKKKSK